MSMPLGIFFAYLAYYKANAKSGKNFPLPLFIASNSRFRFRCQMLHQYSYIQIEFMHRTCKGPLQIIVVLLPFKVE